MRLRGSSFVFLVVLAACAKKETPAAGSAGAAPSVASARPAPTTTVVVAPVDAGAAGADPLRTPAAIAKEATPPEDAKRSGNVRAWSVSDGDFSLVLVTTVDDKNVPRPAHIVRRTSGEVSDLQIVTMIDGDYAVAWTSSLVGGKGQVSAVAFVSADLAKASPPVTLALLGRSTEQGHIALAKAPEGGVLVAHEAAPGNDSVAFEVRAVSPSGHVAKLGRQTVAGGPSPELWIVDLQERGALVYGSSMAGGRTMATLHVPWRLADGGAPSAPAAEHFDAPICFGAAAIPPELSRGTKGEVVCLDVDLWFGEKVASCMAPLRGEAGRCLRIAVTGKDGKTITPPGTADTPVSKVECVDKKVKLTYPGGAVTLASKSAYAVDWLKAKCE